MNNVDELKHVPFGLGEVNPYNKHFTGTSYLNVLNKSTDLHVRATKSRVHRDS